MTTTTNNPLTPEATKFFLGLADDSHNWDGIPLLDINSEQEKGYLTACKRHGLLTTERDEDNHLCYWIIATGKGRELARQLGNAWCE
jgi:hypothetical protein